MRLANKLSVPGAMTALFVLSVAACSGGGSNDGASSAGGPGVTGTDDGGPGSSSGASGGSSGASSGSSGASSGSTSGGPPPPPEPSRCTAAAADFEGVDMSKVPAGTAPAGCVHGYDEKTHAITITMATGTTASISGNNGEITVNGVACTTAGGVTAKVADAKSVVILGANGNETLIVDLSSGPIGGLLADLSAGTDTFVIKGSTNADTIYAGTSKAGIAFDWSGDLLTDGVFAGGESFLVSMGPGNDTFHGGGAKNFGTPVAVPFTLYGGAGSDTLEGGSKSDALCGGAGDDTLMAGPTASGDQLEGGDGTDAADFGTRTLAIAVTMDDAPNDGEKGEAADVRKSVENVMGGAGDDVLVGTAGPNTLLGNGGSDTLVGGGSDDVLSGGDGDDTFDEEAAANGADVIDGGNGSDTVLYARRTANVSVLLCTQTSASACPANCGEASEGDRLVNIENASGGSGDDTFVGNASGNSFYGGAGNDTMEGNDGDDYLYGDDGADVLHGGNGDDYLDGAHMVDTFNGGLGTGDICIIEKGEAPTACELY